MKQELRITRTERGLQLIRVLEANARPFTLVSVEALHDGTFRIRFTHKETFSTKERYMVSPEVFSAAPVRFDISENDESVVLSTKKGSVEIRKESLAFTWRDGGGGIVHKEPLEHGKYLADVHIKRAVFNEKTQIVSRSTADGGKKQDSIPLEFKYDRSAYSFRYSFNFAEDEKIFGLGQHEEGILNYRGKQRFLYQENMQIPVPFIISSLAYGILWDTYSVCEFRDDEQGSYFWSKYCDQLEYYFFFGPSWDEIIAGFRKLTGGSPMSPRWSYGYAQSKERYKTQDELIGIVAEHRKRNIPLDCVIQDWKYWNERYWGEKNFDETRYPDPQKMTDEIHELNAKVLISIWPHMRGECPDQIESRRKGFLLGNDQTYDAFNPEARGLYWKNAYERLFSKGMDGWWCDCTEPFEMDWFGSVKPGTTEQLDRNVGAAETYMDPELILAYPLLHTRGGAEHWPQESDKRVINLTRAYYPGQQQYGTITWSGDIAASWKVYKNQIAEGLSYTLSGAPKWTLDIGGFFVKNKDLWFWKGDYPDGVADLGFRELYVRWFQYGAFLPMFRSHGTDIAREVWEFGNPGEPFYDALITALELRYSLMPYIYTLAAMETFDHYTMMRHLGFDFPADQAALDCRDQFMFGPSIMVCPVTEAMLYGPGSTPIKDAPGSRKVYLPEGCGWYDFWTERRFDGGQWIDVPVSIDKMPLFVKEGAVIPIVKPGQYVDETIDGPWDVRVYAGRDGEFSVYEDAGDGYGYLQGEFARTRLSWNDKKKFFNAGKPEGDFPGINKEREIRYRVVVG